MRNVLLMGVLAGLGLCAGAGAAASAKDGPVVRWHFVGTTALQGNTNASRFREVCALPSTGKMVEEALSKLASSPARLFRESLASTNVDFRPLVRPLLDDLLAQESMAESRGGGGGPAEWVVAVRLDDPHAERWKTSWTAIVAALGAAKQVESKVEGFPVWESKRDRAPSLLRLARAKDWVVLGWGQDKLGLQAEWLKRIQASGRPGAPSGDSWLELEADLQALARPLALPADVSWPRAQMTLTGRGANVRSNLRLEYAQALGLKLEPWHIPTNTVREPLVSFTALRGIHPWLAARPLAEALGLQPAPNQLFGFAQALTPFETYWAWSLPDQANALPQAALRLAGALTNHYPQFAMGQIVYLTNRAQVTWQGLPVLVPFLRPAQENDFVLAGVFPKTGGPKVSPPAPAELYAQVTGPADLVYYDWEITEQRVSAWRSLRAFYELLAKHGSPPTNSPALLWLADTNVTRQLGNAVTECSSRSPRELAAVRTSAVGLTGFELVSLAHWISNPAFPAYVPVPARVERKKPAAGQRPPPRPASGE
jgi:hypothetical protein